METQSPKIGSRFFIRKRPLSSKEEKAKDIDVVNVASRDYVTIHEPKTKVDLTSSWRINN